MPLFSGEMGEIMLYRVSAIMGGGYAEISRRKSLEKAISDAVRACIAYGDEIAPLINGKPLASYRNQGGGHPYTILH